LPDRSQGPICGNASSAPPIRIPSAALSGQFASSPHWWSARMRWRFPGATFRRRTVRRGSFLSARPM